MTDSARFSHKHTYDGPTWVSYRLQPCWYDHTFAGLPYEVEALIEAVRAIGGKVYRVWYNVKSARHGCGEKCDCLCHPPESNVDVSAEYLTERPTEFEAPLV